MPGSGKNCVSSWQSYNGKSNPSTQRSLHAHPCDDREGLICRLGGRCWGMRGGTPAIRPLPVGPSDLKLLPGTGLDRSAGRARRFLHDGVALAQEHGNTKNFWDLATFQPDKKHDLGEVLGEWCRLWKSYWRGLSSTGSFLSPSRPTTGARPRSASKSSGRTGGQLKWNVGHLVETRGEAYLRITHCRKEELEVDFSEVYSTYLVRQMRERQQAKIQGRTQFWRTRTKTYDSVQRVIAAYRGDPPDVDTGNV